MHNQAWTHLLHYETKKKLKLSVYLPFAGMDLTQIEKSSFQVEKNALAEATAMAKMKDDHFELVPTL